MKSIFERIPCNEVECKERIDCCTTVRWRVSQRDYHDEHFREWWLLHEGARIYEEDGINYIQWPMRCKNVAEDGLRCLKYDERPEVCRQFVCKPMAGKPKEETNG
ncbi:YkgJ family cysteine cluster protein [Candidatus Latescibacterota bacterium]